MSRGSFAERNEYTKNDRAPRKRVVNPALLCGVLRNGAQAEWSKTELPLGQFEQSIAHNKTALVEQGRICWSE